MREVKDDVDGWNVNMPGPIESKEAPALGEEKTQVPPSGDRKEDGAQLAHELSGWGMEIPGVIGEGQDDGMDLPGVIGAPGTTAEASDPVPEKTEKLESEVAPDPSNHQMGEVTETEFMSFPVGGPETSSKKILDEIDGEGSPEDFWAIDEEEKKTPSGDEALAQRVKELLMPAIEGMVKEYCQKNVEKVAWEVIPDLAENLIKKEIHHIAQSDTTSPSDT